MKVKLFWEPSPMANGGKNAQELEGQINAWLSENPRIKVLHVNQSCSGGAMSGSLWLISVWYEDGID